MSKQNRPALNLALFVATIATTFGAGLFVLTSGELTRDNVIDAALFSFSVLLILGSHEMGHYLLARHHDVDTSLPYFIPMPPPIGMFGTMGAVIRLRGRIPNRDALVDIGAAGPLAGLAIALPLMIAGLMASHVGDAPVMPSSFPGPTSLWVLVPKLVRWAAAELRHLPTDPDLDVSAAMVFGDNLLTMGLQRLVFGVLPPGREVYAHPVFIAAWFGLLVTMMNLFPIGQLDGGHLTYAWFGDRAQLIGKILAVFMALLAIFFSVSWVLWLLLTTKVIGFRHPEVTQPDLPLSRSRKLVCVACFVFFVLTLMPVQISTGATP